MERLLNEIEVKNFIASFNGREPKTDGEMDICYFIDTLESIIMNDADYAIDIGKFKRKMVNNYINRSNLDDPDYLDKKKYILTELKFADIDEKKSQFFSKVYEESYMPGNLDFIFKYNNMLERKSLKKGKKFDKFIKIVYKELMFLISAINGAPGYDISVLESRETFPKTVNYLLKKYPTSFDSQMLDQINKILENEIVSDCKAMSISRKSSYIRSKSKALREIRKQKKQKIMSKVLL